MNNVNNGFEFVDLGLPSGTLWATCNLGANKPEEYGLYFAWGETEGQTNDTNDGRSFDWAHAPFNGGQSSYSEIEFAKVSGTTCPNGVLAPEYDAATQNLGGKWRMPTKEEFKELFAKTTARWIRVNGIYGRKFTSKFNGNSIFVPASGCRGTSILYYKGSGGFYWCSSLYLGKPNDAWFMHFNNASQKPDYYCLRYYGFTVRPVMSKN